MRLHAASTEGDDAYPSVIYYSRRAPENGNGRLFNSNHDEMLPRLISSQMKHFNRGASRPVQRRRPPLPATQAFAPHAPRLCLCLSTGRLRLRHFVPRSDPSPPSPPPTSQANALFSSTAGRRASTRGRATR